MNLLAENEKLKRQLGEALEQLTAANRALDESRGHSVALAGHCGNTTTKLYDAMAKIADFEAKFDEARRQEPVVEHSRIYDSKLVADRVTILVPIGYKLYAAPVPAQQSTRPAPCEHLCESKAFEIEIRQLKVQLDKAQQSPAVAVPYTGNCVKAKLMLNELQRKASLKTCQLTGNEGVFVPMDLWHPLRDLLRDIGNPATESKKQPRINEQDAREVVEYLYSVREFINNGVEFGFIRLPEFPDDPANSLLPRTDALLTKLNGEEQ